MAYDWFRTKIKEKKITLDNIPIILIFAEDVVLMKKQRLKNHYI